MLPDTTDHEASRPGCLWFAVLILAVYQIALVIHGLLNGDVYVNSLTVPLELTLLINGMWAILLIISAGWMWVRPQAGTRAGSWLIFGTVVYHLMYTVLFAQSDYERGRVPLIMILFVLILIVRLGWWWSHRQSSTQT